MRLPKHVYFNPFFRLCNSRSTERHVFVVGPPRSGTTLLANVISNHSAICTYSSETGLFTWYSLFVLYEGMAGRNSWEFNKLRRQCHDIVDLFDRLAEERKAETGAYRFLEKTPQHVLYLPFILKRFPKASIVNIVRDPRDGFVSSRSNSAVPQKSARSFARYWRHCVESRLRIGKHPALVDVTYETFVHQPQREMARVMQAIGEDFEPSQLDPTLMSQAPHAGTQQFRLLGKPVSNRSVGRWRTELSETECNEIRRNAGPAFSDRYSD